MPATRAAGSPDRGDCAEQGGGRAPGDHACHTPARSFLHGWSDPGPLACFGRSGQGPSAAIRGYRAMPWSCRAGRRPECPRLSVPAAGPRCEPDAPALRRWVGGLGDPQRSLVRRGPGRHGRRSSRGESARRRGRAALSHRAARGCRRCTRPNLGGGPGGATADTGGLNPPVPSGAWGFESLPGHV
jgi:hypothetical protein